MEVALIPHFSWWNPFTWDFDQIWADVTQGFGQPHRTAAPVTGKRLVHGTQV
jgi:hypothetical protein